MRNKALIKWRFTVRLISYHAFKLLTINNYTIIIIYMFSTFVCIINCTIWAGCASSTSCMLILVLFRLNKTKCINRRRLPRFQLYLVEVNRNEPTSNTCSSNYSYTRSAILWLVELRQVSIMSAAHLVYRNKSNFKQIFQLLKVESFCT